MSEKRRQICFTIEESEVKKMEDIKKRTGIPVSKQVEMRLKGYRVERVEDNSEG